MLKTICRAYTFQLKCKIFFISSAYASNWTLSKNIAIAMLPAFHTTFSMTKLESSHDKGSPCLKRRTVSKGSERSIPTLTELQELLNVILHSLISFAGIRSSDIAAKTRSLMELSKAAL